MTKQENFIDWRSIFKVVIKVLSWTAFLILLIIGAFLLYYVISAKIYGSKGEDYKPSFSLYTIVSGSMEPKIKVYDVILNINVKDKSNLKKGDIITFVSSNPLTNGMIITHRIIDIVPKDGIIYFRTKGDNNKTPDTGLQNENSILGKTILKIPLLGRIQFFLASRGGWIMAILIPALGVIIYDIMKIFKLVGVKGKLDKVTTPKPEIIDEKQEKKEKLFKFALKRKFLLKNSLPKLEDVKEEKEEEIEIQDLSIDVKNNIEVEKTNIDEPKIEVEEINIDEPDIEVDSNDINQEIDKVLTLLEEVNEELDKDKSDID